MGYFIGLMGVWVLQDALASIAYYPNEKWRWNHAASLLRVLIGVVLIVLGGLLL